MKKISVSGGKVLKGQVVISGAKNSALPILAASLLCEGGKSTISNIPDLADIDCMKLLLRALGITLTVHGKETLEHGSENRYICVDASNIEKDVAVYNIVNRMRASVLVLAPILARKGRASVAMPGGCAIGMRPVDLHLEVLRAMGAEIVLENGYINASIKNAKLQGCEFTFPQISVGATETAIMAAVLAKGVTVLHNVAREPEVVDLCEYLKKCGAKISGYGTSTITIEGVEKLNGVKHKVIPDRIEAGTYAIAAAISCGDITLKNINIEHIGSVIAKLCSMGLEVEVINNSTARFRYVRPLSAVDVVTKPYPEFPTDLQAQFLALHAIASGKAMFEETIFENRFMHVSELIRMGADIEVVSNKKVVVRGVEKLSPAETNATDLRASAALVLAAIATQGRSVISEVEHLFRGYGNVIEKLQSLGVEIQLV